MDLSTTARVKTLGSITSTDLDALLDQLVTAYSSQFEKYLGRPVQTGTRTEVVELQAGCRVLTLDAAPVTAITSVKFNTTRNFTTETALTIYDDYQVNYVAGYIRLEGNQMARPGYVEVIYTGGMAATQAAFSAAYPEIADALDLQVLQHLRRVTQGSVDGNVNAQGAGTSNENPLQLTKRTLEVLNLHRRRRV